jgi:hypothetical protein
MQDNTTHYKASQVKSSEVTIRQNKTDVERLDPPSSNFGFVSSCQFPEWEDEERVSALFSHFDLKDSPGLVSSCLALLCLVLSCLALCVVLPCLVFSLSSANHYTLI